MSTALACLSALSLLWVLMFDHIWGGGVAGALAGAILFVIFIACLAFRRVALFWLLPIFFSFLWVGLSVVVLEYGHYAPEIDVVTYSNGASIRYFFLVASFALGVFCFAPRAHVVGGESFFLWFSCFYVVLFLILFLNGLVYGFPFLSAEQRFYYWGGHPFGGGLSKILAYSSFFWVCGGWFLGGGRRNYKYALIFLSLLHAFLAVLYSNKASFFLVAIFSFFGGYAVGRVSAGGRIVGLKAFILLGAAFVLILILVFFSYRWVHGYSLEEALGLMLERVFVMQGQLWWAIDDCVIHACDSGEGVRLFRRVDGEAYGIFAMMEIVMPAHSFQHYFSNKVPLTGGFPANIMLASGIWLAAFFCFAIGGGSGVFLRGMSAAIQNGSLMTFLYVFVYSSLAWALSLGSFNLFVDPLFLSVIGGIVLCHAAGFWVRCYFSRGVV